MKREELIRSQEYVFTGIQLQLLNMIESYMKKNGLKRNQLADKLGVSKGYISQLLNVAYDHKISKLVDLSLSCNAMPLLYFVDLEKYIQDDAEGKTYDLLEVISPKEISFRPAENNSPQYSDILQEAKLDPIAYSDSINMKTEQFTFS